MHLVVNEEGLRFIRAELITRHRRGIQMKNDAVRAWAQDVEASAVNGEKPYFEIRSTDTFSGHTEVVEVPSECLSYRYDDDFDYDL